MNRRHFLSFTGFGALMAATGFPVLAAETITPLNLSDAEWKKRLPPASYTCLLYTSPSPRD